jgi:hypothetical protein
VAQFGLLGLFMKKYLRRMFAENLFRRIVNVLDAPNPQLNRPHRLDHPFLLASEIFVVREKEF